jgi:aminoglycoside phosphotransferase (APT) family kinase protein
MSVRLPSSKYHIQQVEKEQYWLPKLAPSLPLSIPVPLAMGAPNEGYPWHWSVYRWLEGGNAATSHITDLSQFATTLAQFLVALQQIDPADGPAPGTHNFFRGGSLEIYNSEARRAIATLGSKIDTNTALQCWEDALKATWFGKPVWFHGDVSAANLLVKNGRLSAVIDFGQLGVGDPSCDLTIAWTFLSGESRERFRAILQLDDATWARARGWALWKELCSPAKPKKSLGIVGEILADYRNKGCW